MKRFGLLAVAAFFASALFYLPASISRQEVTGKSDVSGNGHAVQPDSAVLVAGGKAASVRTSAQTQQSEPDDATAAQHRALPAPAEADQASTPQERPSRTRTWDETWLASLREKSVGDALSFDLVAGETASGVIGHLRHEDNQVVYVAGELTRPERGRFFFQKQSMPGVAGAYVGVVELPRSRRAYRLEPAGQDGAVQLVERRLGEVVCVQYPRRETTSAGESSGTEEIPPLKPGDFPTLPIPGYQKGIVRLQSLPGARAVVYLDFQGGYTPTWGGITYAKPGMSNNQIREVWLRVAEDYMPFQVNITTDLAVYEAAAENSRQRVIITPTSTAQPGAGGVAYMNSFNWTGDTPAWVFLTSPKDCAEACAHEVGHTLGLSHDGRDVNGSLTEYYGGQGSGDLAWAPVMGVGYGRNVSQWSKGEYSGANNTEDDLLIITTRNNSVAYRTDDAAATATSRYLEIQPSFVASAQGVIERSGDVDAFNFSTRGGQVVLRADPVSVGPNLALRISLHTAAGEQVLAAAPGTTLWASLSTNLPAGDYTVRVTGAERGSAVATGFSAYGSLGYYSISGTVANAVVASRFAVAENAVAGTVVGVLAPDNPDNHALTFRIAAGNAGGTFAIDDHGVITVAAPHALDFETLGKSSQLPVQFELFVEIVDTTDNSLSSLNHRVVIGVSDVNEPPEAAGFRVALVQNTQADTVFGSIQASDPDAYTLLAYSLVAGNENGWFRVDPASGELAVANDLPEAAIGAHELSVRISDQQGTSALSVTSTVAVTVVPNLSGLRPGSISYAAYTNLSGTSLASLTNSPRFPLDPAYEKQLPRFEADRDVDDRFGAVIRGYVIPAVSGQYRFFIASDDSSQLWISTSTNSASLSLIASVNDGFWTSPREWTRYSSQQSRAITLTAGQAYYIEARTREGTGSDHLAVAWESLSNGIQRGVIPGQYLAPHHLNYLPRAENLSIAVHRDAIGGSRLGKVAVSDVNSEDVHTFAITAGSAGIFSIDPDTGTLRVADDEALQSTAQTSFVLAVKVEDNGVPVRSRTSTVSVKLVNTNAITATVPQQEVFWNVGTGTSVADLTNKVKYPRRPDQLFPLSGWVGQSGIGENYGSRVRALLVPVSSGSYYFHLSSDDSSALRFSSTSDPAAARQIAWVSGYTDPDRFDKYPSQRSAAVSLVAGRSYYLETLHKEGAALDHLTLAWSGPGVSGTNPIPASVLRPVNINYAPQAPARTAQISRNVTNGSFVVAIAAVDSPADLLTYRIVGGNDFGTFRIDPDSGMLTVEDNSSIADYLAGAFELEVQVQDSGFGGLFPRKSAFSSVTITVSDGDAFLWSGAGSNDQWDDAQNWVGGSPPPERASLAFAGEARQTNYNTHLTAAGPVSLSGGFHIRGQPVRLLGGLSSVGDNTWEVDSTLNRDQGFTNVSGALLIAGTVDLNAHTLWLNAAENISLAGTVAGEGSLVKLGAGALTLRGSNHFAGSVEVRGGALLLGASDALAGKTHLRIHSGAVLESEAASQAVTIEKDTVLSLAGVVSAPAVVLGGLRTGTEIGVATFQHSLVLRGSTELRVGRKDGALAGDVIKSEGSLTLGGTLTIVSEGEPLQPGDRFQVFQTETLKGEFAAVELPRLSAGLRWDLETLSSAGAIRVVTAAPQMLPPNVNASGGLEIGIATEAGLNYELQEAESLGEGAEWRAVSQHQGDGEPLNLSVPFDPSRPCRFFRFRVY